MIKSDQENIMKKILVTGCDGFLASRFIEYYNNKYEIVKVNRK